MRRCINRAKLLALATLLTACGQTGPLYLPEPSASEPSSADTTSSEPRQSASTTDPGDTETTKE